MNVFNAPDFDRHEQVSFFSDRKTGLRAIIAIHSTTLGPACGGTRMYPYGKDDDALTDALRLSRGMSYKNAMAGLPLGGGKAVIIGNPAREKTEELLLAYANAVNALSGRYITAMDVGMTPQDIAVIARGTPHAAGYDEPGKRSGDSAPATSLGVFEGLKEAVHHRLKTDALKGLTVAVQGLGKVGMGVAERLHDAGAKLIVADVDPAAVRRAVDRFGAETVPVDRIAAIDCEVFSPNALGAVLNDRSIEALRAVVVAGAANNQLERDRHGQMLRDHGVLYAPDYVINSGGVIHVAGQIFGWSDGEIATRVHAIAGTLKEIFRRADMENRPTSVVSDLIAEDRMAMAAKAAARCAAE
jgi:leucine dehydrogenase